MSTYTAKPAEIQRQWHVIDASGQPLGRLATRVATLLRGKHKPIYSPHLDTGDYVVVLNAEKVAFTGKKVTEKVYYHHSMYPGGLKAIRLKEMMAKHPERVIEKAVKGMLPKGALGKQIFSKLRVYTGEEHPHIAQVNAGAAKARRAARAEAAPAVTAAQPKRARKSQENAPAVAEPAAAVAEATQAVAPQEVSPAVPESTTPAAQSETPTESTAQEKES